MNCLIHCTNIPLCFTVSRILSLLINSVNQIPFFLLALTQKVKVKLKLIKAPADITQGALLMESAVSPLATDWSLDWEIPMVTAGNTYLKKKKKKKKKKKVQQQKQNVIKVNTHKK